MLERVSWGLWKEGRFWGLELWEVEGLGGRSLSSMLGLRAWRILALAAVRVFRGF